MPIDVVDFVELLDNLAAIVVWQPMTVALGCRDSFDLSILVNTDDRPGLQMSIFQLKKIKSPNYCLRYFIFNLNFYQPPRYLRIRL
jgi:hypothetical protein